MYELDKSLFFQINHGLSAPWMDAVMMVVTTLGLGWVQGVGALAFASIAQIAKSQSYLRLYFLPALLVVVASGVGAQIVKRLIPRERPSNLPGAIVAPDERIFYNSFPSGHATTSFAMAMYVWSITRGTRYRSFGWAAWVLAALVALSRIYRGVHYPSDVIAGAALGAAIGWICLRFYAPYKTSASPGTPQAPSAE